MLNNIRGGDANDRGENTMRIVVVIVALLFLLLAAAGVILLQIFLSKKESKWAGLILPIISFGISLLGVMGIFVFFAFSATSMHMADGEIIEETVTQIGDVSSIIATAIYVFLLGNIPTAILAAIYAACRGKRNKQRALDKMRAKDL